MPFAGIPSELREAVEEIEKDEPEIPLREVDFSHRTPERDRRFSLRVSTYYERFQQSLFYVPALYIVGAGVLAWSTNWFDRAFAERLPELPFLLPTTVESARSTLSTIAGATITVAGVVLD
ncbi:MAG: DUF2254 domain-containing protein, partial [Actinobacteria bacterium]|nr:DUF2254 domain-containing protein [Actinomycetota bacterium]